MSCSEKIFAKKTILSQPAAGTDTWILAWGADYVRTMIDSAQSFTFTSDSQRCPPISICRKSSRLHGRSRVEFDSQGSLADPTAGQAVYLAGLKRAVWSRFKYQRSMNLTCIPFLQGNGAIGYQGAWNGSSGASAFTCRTRPTMENGARGETAGSVVWTARSRAVYGTGQKLTAILLTNEFASLPE